MIISSKRENKQHVRLARLAVATFFFLNGVLTATMSTRLPSIQMKLALPTSQLGLALLGCTVGGLLAMNIAGRSSRHLGSNVLTTTATLGMAGALPLMTFAPTLPFLVLALILFGAGSGAMDVAMNIQGVEVERAYGRSIMNSFHACFSVGSLLGAVLGSILAALHVSPAAHFLAIAIGAGIGIVLSARFLLPTQPEPLARKTRSRHFSPTLMLLGVIAFCVLLSVGALFDWSAVYLAGTLHEDAGLAAAGFATFLVCMALGRAVGDTLVTRFGAVALMRSACVLAASGLALALLFSWTPMTFVGLGLVGIGLSVPLPLVLSAAGRQSKQNTGSTLTAVTTWGYAGMIVGPPVIGFVADRVGLRLALTLVVALCVLAAFCARAVQTSTAKEDAVEEEAAQIGVN